ncbi:PD-(D/E)XK nuclease family protein [Candidatus Woesearchaeota archaeon]|nr:PD-(D/E)XK nuclease family protein [Candidatus Woesearchaeota archaeon]
MVVFSHSRISTFEQCPFRYKAKYVDKLLPEFETSIEAFLGSAAHHTLEKLYKDLQHGKMPTIEELQEELKDFWQKNYNENTIIFVKKGYTAENYFVMATKFVNDYYNRFKPFNQSKVIACEKKVEVPLNNEYSMLGYIDRVDFKDDAYEIHDYKTSSSLPEQSKLDVDRQLALYAYAIKQMFDDANKIRLVWHYLAFDKTVTSTRTDDELEKLKEHTIQVIKTIQSAKEFPTTKSALCGWCEFRPHCPEFKHMYETEQLTPKEFHDDDGVRLVDEYVGLSEAKQKVENRLEKTKNDLVAFAKQKNITQVIGSNAKASVREYDGIKFPEKNSPERALIKNILAKHGLLDSLQQLDFYELTKKINSKELPTDVITELEEHLLRTKNGRVYIAKK